MKTIVLGAGFSGLAAGYNTGWPIYEASTEAGGVCKTYNKDGFVFQSGGPHWIFENGNVTQAMDFIKSLVELKSYERNAGVYYNKIFPYPLQRYSQNGYTTTVGYFKEWLHDKFGQEMCNMFFHPFNEKYTAGLMDEIIQYDSYKTPTSGTGWVNKFHDPVNGLDDLVNKMAKKCDVKYNKKIIEINTKAQYVLFENGTAEVYDKLISTIPLDQLLIMCGQTDHDLPYSSVLVLNIGAEPGRNLPKEHWLYIPFCKCNFYRVGFYTNVDNTKAPSGKVGLSVEMAFRGVEYDDLDIDYITYHVIQELQSWGWIDKVITTDPTWVSCAYSWLRDANEPTKHLQWLKDRNILSIGRYGKWKFQGLAESIMDGLNVS